PLLFIYARVRHLRHLHSLPTRRSSDLKTGETNLIGVLVRRATGRTLADYAREKIWKPAGMEQDGFWMVDQTGAEISGCCMSLSRSEEHTSELQSRENLVCRLLLEKKKT